MSPLRTSRFPPASRGLYVIEVKLTQLAQLLFLGLAQRALQRFLRGVGVDAPVLGEVFANLSLLVRSKSAEGAAQEHDRALELVVVQRRHVAGEFLPQRLPREQRRTVALRESLEPAGAQVGRDAGRETARHFAGEV